MKLDPMAALRADATKKINDHFAILSAWGSHIERAHAAKLAQARSATPSAPFVAEAEARGISPADLAELVITKAAQSDPVMEREARRQAALIAVEKAANPAIILGVVDNLPK